MVYVMKCYALFSYRIYKNDIKKSLSNLSDVGCSLNPSLMMTVTSFLWVLHLTEHEVSCNKC